MSLSRSVSLVLALAAASVVEAQVQVQIDRAGGLRPAAAPGAKDLQSVYVRDSGIASERMALAERMEKLAEWDKAADVYQEILEKYADRVVPRRTDANNQITQYMSVTLVVQEKLAAWPKEGLDAYRRRFEDSAAEKLAAVQPGDFASLHRVLAGYFPTDSGKQAGLRLMADSFERGEFASSAWIGRRLLQLHPSLVENERATVLFQTALAEHLAGNDAQAKQKLAELQTKHAEATASIAGQDAKLVDVLANELKQASTLTRTFRSDSWPMPFGTPDSSALPEAVSTGGARLFGVEVGGMPTRGSISARNARSIQWAQPMPNDRKFGATTGILPSIDSGELFFQDNARLFAINLASGLPLTGWQQTYPGEKRGAYAIDTLPTPPGKQLGVQVTGDRVFAVMGQNDLATGPMGQFNAQGLQPTLVCLDRVSGKRVWGSILSKLKLPDEQASLKEGVFYGTPLVIGDTVYALARAQRGGQFEECHIVAMKLSDGSYKWSSYIASTAGNRFMTDDSDFFGTGATAQMSYSDGRLYVLTNLGAVACVDAADGNTLWLNIYTRGNENAGWMPGAARRAGFIQSARTVFKPYTINPPVITDGRLFILPSDSPNLFVYDATTGEQVTEFPRRVELPSVSTSQEDKFQTLDMLLAVRGESLILGSRQAIVMLPWRTYNVAKSLIDNDARFRLFGTSVELGDEQREVIRGRPFVSQKYVLVPTAEKMCRLSIDAFKIDAIYPVNGKWDDEEQPGNVLATSDHLIIAGPTRVTAYADLAVATGKLDERIKLAPDEVEPYLRYAELLLAGGKPADSIAYIDKAEERLGGTGNLRRGEQRDRLFEICCSFAIKLQKTTVGSGDASAANKEMVAVIRKLYDRARDAADRPPQQVRFRLALATLLRALKEDAAELALHQEILANPDWRTAPVAGRNGASTAATEAELAIAELIERSGDSIYATYEARAAERLAAATKGSKDGDALLAIADEYPTSKSSTQALALAAEDFEATQPRKAAQTLRRLLKRDLPEDRRLATLESLARTYLATPGQIDTAIVRLQQAAKLNGTATLARPISLPDGRTLEKMSYAAAQQMLQRYRTDAATRALPMFGVLPSSTAADPSTPPLQPAVEIGAASAIVDQQPGAARHDRIVAYTTNNAIAQYPVGAKQPLGRPVPFDEQPVGCAYSGDTLIVVGPTQAMAISADGEKTVWKLSLGSLPGAEVATAARDEQTAASGDATDDDIVQQQLRIQTLTIRANRMGINGAVDLDDEAAVVAGGAERISGCRVLSDRLVLGTTSGRVISLELATGHATWQTRPSDLPIRHFLASEDFVAVSYTDQNPSGVPSTEVVVLDAITGQITLRDNYDGQNNGKQLVNLALSRDGVLVAMLPRGLRARDLYDPKTPEWKQDNIGNPMNDGLPLSMSIGPEQMVITDDRVLVMFRSQQGQQSVRAYKLRDQLRPMKIRNEKTGQENDIPFMPRTESNPNDNVALHIRAAGPMFYIFGQKSLAAYHLDNPQSQWWPSTKNMPIARDLVLTQDYAVLVTQTPANPNAAATRVQAVSLQMYSRAITASGVESGALEQRPSVKDPANIVIGQWQVANGAFYYISGDQKLKMALATPATK